MFKAKKGTTTFGGPLVLKAYDEVRVSQMTRQEVIGELKRYAHPTWFHKLLDWSTADLKALLFYYLQPEEDKNDERVQGRPSRGLMRFTIEIQ